MSFLSPNTFLISILNPKTILIEYITLIDRKQNGKIFYVPDLLCILMDTDAFS